jgi:hypothetical protein
MLHSFKRLHSFNSIANCQCLDGSYWRNDCHVNLLSSFDLLWLDMDGHHHLHLTTRICLMGNFLRNCAVASSRWSSWSAAAAQNDLGSLGRNRSEAEGWGGACWSIAMKLFQKLPLLSLEWIDLSQLPRFNHFSESLSWALSDRKSQESDFWRQRWCGSHTSLPEFIVVIGRRRDCRHMYRVGTQCHSLNPQIHSIEVMQRQLPKCTLPLDVHWQLVLSDWFPIFPSDSSPVCVQLSPVWGRLSLTISSKLLHEERSLTHHCTTQLDKHFFGCESADGRTEAEQVFLLPIGENDSSFTALPVSEGVLPSDSLLLSAVQQWTTWKPDRPCHHPLHFVLTYPHLESVFTNALLQVIE